MAMTYNFKLVVEPDEDFDGHPSGWHAYCPSLERQGASTWGEAEDDALKNIKELVCMVVESMLEHGDRKSGGTVRSDRGYRRTSRGGDRLTRAYRLRTASEYYRSRDHFCADPGLTRFITIPTRGLPRRQHVQAENAEEHDRIASLLDGRRSETL